MTEASRGIDAGGKQAGEARQLRSDLQARLHAAETFERIVVSQEVVSRRLIRQSRALIEETRLLLRGYGSG